jgi:hypothetical protein
MQMAERTFVVNESVVYAELDDEAVLLNIESGIYFGLNDVSTEIWKALEHVDLTRLAADVNAFLAALQASELVHAVQG